MDSMIRIHLLRYRVVVQAEYGIKMKVIIMFFSATPPLGIVLGIALSNIYCDDNPTALIVVRLLNAGLLNYMALVDLLAADFMGTKLHANVKGRRHVSNGHMGLALQINDNVK
ncbi:fe(2+) transport protein 1-like [Pyrus ussuriensis x Pyrus communis]|uniref:Fe(2+) transport protein 1-like n=1 Tax=Pyrus ussuriensis x Pyrus communis TaxID=2448454 RepID=A0A5N5HG03_9ROSA|nr:fe(2+) transport protein 1-like [Pyrus ussuriensis x Pyrus communis]